MIHQIDTTDNIVAFRALAEVTNEDFLSVVIPAVEHLVKQTNEINFLLVLDTDNDAQSFTSGAWLQEALLGLKHLGKWNRAAIISDSEEIISFTNGFSYVVPGEFHGFKKEAFNRALNWVEGNINIS
ncbi:STAS/SEC14 domain-containing protein [Flavobacterium sp. FlaQc-57]|uniref:STAS/SEC14 domain-containing protein n=1 Tax=Flavobacterium sp. FlaQc-57 TaxID=3374186 RepID=UPI003757B6D9